MNRQKPVRFYGSFDELRAIVGATGISGRWEWMHVKYWRFRSDTSAILNFWPTTGTINFQGPHTAVDDLKVAVASVVHGDDSNFCYSTSDGPEVCRVIPGRATRSEARHLPSGPQGWLEAPVRAREEGAVAKVETTKTGSRQLHVQSTTDRRARRSLKKGAD